MKATTLLLSLLCSIFLQAFSQNNNFNGTYSSGQITLLIKENNPGVFSGHVASAEGTFNLQASANGNNISGSYAYYGQNIPFTGSLNNNQLTLNSEGQTFIFTKQATQQNNQANTNQNTAQNNNALQTVAHWGIGYQTPNGWTMQAGDGIIYFISSDQKLIMILMPNEESKSLADLKYAAQQGLTDQSVQLSTKGEIVNFGNDGVATALQGVFNGRQALGYVVGRLSPYQVGATVLGVCETADYNNAFKQQVESFARNIQFSQPVRATTSSGAVADWGTYMKGRKLSYLKSDTGFYMEIHIYLCSDGSFAYKDNSGGFGNGASIVADSKYTGRWQAFGNGNSGTLVLNFNDGSKSTYNTELRNEKLYLDGKQYFRVNNDYCN
ncbi:hypothetical protein [Chondrinema litorale]|uniref:hypothetical protein n=1 Tax=Chondrinema litorale TaxID=2994555 RepID=UPI002543412B|nr:hypothetical protein [Chondrinema litorale]UZR95116.1 hypothetical protein OQ292_04705 [Chondrinema litorale]